MARGSFQGLFQAYLDHAPRWEVEPDPLLSTMMHQGLAAAALHLSSRPTDEFTGWTLTISQPQLCLFVTGDAASQRVTGRTLTDGIKPTEQSRLSVQSQRPGEDVIQTAIDVEGLDVLVFFQEYYRKSLQYPARFFEYDDGVFAMVLALPRADIDWLNGLDRDSAALHMEEEHRDLDVRMFSFDCGCDAEKIADVTRGIFEEDPESLFKGEDEVELQCPRCGHRWMLGRGEF